jgi:Beta-carotene isomerase D27-like, C-terminal
MSALFNTAVSFCMQVERCRVLEQSGCASVCVNCCKIPTQVELCLALAFSFKIIDLVSDSHTATAQIFS